MNGNMVWHYTIRDRAASILNDGIIKPATANVPTNETPVVWFSARQHWEPTANKGILDAAGQKRWLSFKETIERGGGWRFGLRVETLTPWRQLIREANISAETVRGLKRAGAKAGADPSLWYASLEPVQVSDCVIQELRDGKWCDWNPRNT